MQVGRAVKIGYVTCRERIARFAIVVFLAAALLSAAGGAWAATVFVIANELNTGENLPAYNEGDTLAVTGMLDTAGFYKIRNATNKFHLVLDSAQTTLAGTGALEDATMLLSITGEGLIEIPNYAFSGCTELVSFTFPNLETIGGLAFEDCTALTLTSLPDSVQTIAEHAFYGCVGITEFTWPSGVTEISRGVFLDCTGLKTITIPETVTDIGRQAFSGCSALETVVFLGSTPPVLNVESSTYPFTGNETFWIPDGSLSAYEGAGFNVGTAFTERRTEFEAISTAVLPYTVKMGNENQSTYRINPLGDFSGATIAVTGTGAVTPTDSGLSATYSGDTFTVSGTAGVAGSYKLPLNVTADGILIGGLEFDLTVTPPLASDFEFDPATPYSVQMGRSNGTVYTLKPKSGISGVTVSITSVGNATPAGSGLSATASGNEFAVSGTAAMAGNYALPLQFTANGSSISGLTFPLEVTALGAADFTASLEAGGGSTTSTYYVMPPNIAGSGTFTLTSAYASGFNLTLNPLTNINAFTAAGLSHSITSNSVTITGTPTVAPGASYDLTFDVMSGSTNIGTIILTVTIATVDPALVSVTATGDSLKSGYPANAKFTVSSSQPGIAPTFTDVGSFPSASGLTGSISDSDTISVGGYAGTPGVYTATVGIDAEGESITDRTVTVEILPMEASDYTISPDRTFYTVYTGVSTDLRLAVETLYEVPDFTVTAVSGLGDFSASGLTASFTAHEIALNGTPQTPGEYRVAVETLMNTVTVTGKELVLRVAELKPTDFHCRSDNNLLTFGQECRADFEVLCIASDTTALKDAEILVQSVRPDETWAGSGLAFEAGEGNTFSISGTPKLAGQCELLADITVNGHPIENIPATVSVAATMADVEAGRIRNATVKGIPLHMAWGTETEINLDFLTTDESGIPFPLPDLSWLIQPDNGMITIEWVSPTVIKLICNAPPERERQRFERLAKGEGEDSVPGTLDSVVEISIDIVQAQPDGVPNSSSSYFVIAVGEQQPSPVKLSGDVLEKFRGANLFLSQSDVMLIPGNGYRFSTQDPDWQLLTELENVEIERLMPNGDLLPECFVPSGKDSINVASDISPQVVLQAGMLPLTYRVVVRQPELVSMFGAETAEKILLNPNDFLDEIFSVIVLHKEIKQGEWAGYFTNLVRGILSPHTAVDGGTLQISGGAELTIVMYYNVIDFEGESFLYDDKFLVVPDGLHDGVIVDPIWLNKWDEKSGSDSGSTGNTSQGGGGCAAGAAIPSLFAIAMIMAIRRRK